MAEKYRVWLMDAERERLEKLIYSGEAKARKLTHARILLKADSSARGRNWTDQQISTSLDVSLATIARVRKRFATQGLTCALNPKVQKNHRPRRLDGEQEAHLIAITCSEPPDGYARWSLRLLADKLVELDVVESISHETVRQTQKKTNSNRG